LQLAGEFVSRPPLNYCRRRRPAERISFLLSSHHFSLGNLINKSVDDNSAEERRKTMKLSGPETNCQIICILNTLSYSFNNYTTSIHDIAKFGGEISFSIVVVVGFAR